LEGSIVKRIQNLAVIVALLTLVMATPGCGVINSLRAKDSLNDGVRAFNQGHFDIAQRKFEYALELRPDNTNAQLFYARALSARFDQGQEENLGLKTIAAYDNIVKQNPDNGEAIDQALAFKAKVYEDLAGLVPEKGDQYEQTRRDTLLKRADMPTATAQTKADVHYTLGVEYWKKAYKLDGSWVSHNQAVPPEVGEKVKPLTQKAHEHLQQALSVKPDYANAYYYLKLAFLQDMYTEPNPAKKKEFLAKATQAADKYTELQKQLQQQAAAQGESAAQPSASK
jgi:tetratricopeptide (TPR) repeat protein